MRINVQKYDPSRDAAPYMVSGEIEYRDKMTALEALMDFCNQVEYVNFDYHCGERECGRCSMLIDGQPRLICVEPIDDAEHTFEPLPGFPIMHDLIVDKTRYDDRISATMNRIRMEDYTLEQATQCDFPTQTRDLIYGIDYCCRCAVCDAGCPAKQMYPDEFVGPSRMLAIGYRYLDPYDQGDRLMEAVSGGLFRCIMCGQCDINCAEQDVKHVELWNVLRDAAKERGIVPSYAQEA